jgi:hypothetical protein
MHERTTRAARLLVVLLGSIGAAWGGGCNQVSGVGDLRFGSCPTAEGPCDGYPCTSDHGCGASTDCRTARCVDGVCKTKHVAAGAALPDPTPGDCMRPSCDGHGNAELVPDVSDTPPAASACVVPTCSAGVSVQSPAPEGTSCSDGGSAQVCDGAGACVACVTDMDCTTGDHPSCDPSHTCVSCSDGAQNGGETGVDCGGSCLKCDGDPCMAPTDCKSQMCNMSNVCGP